MGPYRDRPEVFPRTWEKVSKMTYRLRVLNGWIVSKHEHGMVFISDPDSRWVLEPKPEEK